MRTPFLVAYSKTVRTNKLEQELEQMGFDMFVETPVTNDKIHELLHYVEARENEFLEV